MIALIKLPLLLLAPLLAQEGFDHSMPPPPHIPAVVWIIYCAVLLLIIAGMWKVFTKAGQPGWAVLIPFYNLYVLCKIAGRPGWWLILLLIPMVNFIFVIILCIDIAKNFGKGAGFGVGLAFLGFIFFPILGFGSATYQGGGPPPM